MDAIGLMIALFLNLGTICNALPAEIHTYEKNQYMVQLWVCEKAPGLEEKAFRAWHRYCHEGKGYWSRPFMLEEVRTNQGFYMDRFGEIHASECLTCLAQNRDIYIPSCGV